MNAARDPYLDLTLDGVHLIEASAGTGKTYTLATLVTRLVVERGLRVGQILAVTFTEAATQELRKRIRERLQLTLALLDTVPGADDSAEVALSHALLQAHRERSDEDASSLRRRLRQATLEIDLAAIFTIHGFCARVLREHALEAGHGFDAPELLADDRDLRAALAADLWRSHAQDEAGAEDLVALWTSHEALAQDLRTLLREPVLLPPPGGNSDLAAAQARFAAAEAALQAAWHAYGDAFFDALSAAIADGVMKANIYKPDWLAHLRQWLLRFSADPQRAGDLHPKLEKLTVTALESGTKKEHAARTPASPLSAAVLAYLDARGALESATLRRRAALLHRLRDDARARLTLLKRQRRLQTYDDLIDGVADALAGPQCDMLTQRLRAQYTVALLDEFQDTDARQWAIFDTVFGHGSEHPALFLIGDPKQAIYGFRGGDVHTYLDAARGADRAPLLSHNFRSRPTLLAALAALYAQAGDAAFVDDRIQFHPVESGGKQTDDGFLRDGRPAPALTLWQAPLPPPDDKGKRRPWSVGESRTLATRACVAAIHALLTEAGAGQARLLDKNTKALRILQAGDLAVLVRSHHEATLMRQALALAGIPAVAAGKLSLFATNEARELHAVLLALLHGGDDGRLRAALATVLVGVDARGIEALDTQADVHRDWQLAAMRWREHLQRGGPLALVNALCATQAERLLGLLDGERRVSNYLQLAELLQEAQARVLGLHGLVDWLARRIVNADPNDETQLLRLESDARCVQIVTLHKSKGLEYPLVFLPFVGIGRQEKGPGRNCVAHDAHLGRRLHWKLDLPEAQWDEASGAWQKEQRAEDARLLYVGLTRAEHALWIASGEFYAHARTPLAMMLSDTQALTAAGIVLDASEPPLEVPRLPAQGETDIPAARRVARRLDNDWWVHSFSQWSRADVGEVGDVGDASTATTLPAGGGKDEPEAMREVELNDADVDPRFVGNRYGVALHAALEHTDFVAWRDWRDGGTAPHEQADVIAAALRHEGYADELIDDGVALSTRLIGHTLTVRLPEGVRLCDLDAGERRAEIEFQFALQPVRVEALLHLLHAHGVVRERHGFGLRQRLEGLMTGLIDLTYRANGKWYVLDYKSNRLPDYEPASLVQAMAHSEYDLQALIYTLALHRWLRFRLGADYDYARDFGGIRYLFCRGLDATRADSPGIHAQCFAPDLVHGLDALFGLASDEAAA
jgi:exodeoxyribonuclease V beta subunit